MAKYLSTLLYIGVFLSSCQKEAPIRQITGFDSPPAINGQGLAADSFYVVPLESKNNVIISDIRKIDFVDSSMVILSSEAFFLSIGKDNIYVNMGKRVTAQENTIH